uniref:Poly(A) polymerase catalytic subunit domain-containing protein n=1 Tax=viral metagenome TaxID=1070528 RepID=A0A6C0CQB4_9ZZZZ
MYILSNVYIYIMSACKKNLTFQEKELAILRMAVDLAEEKAGRKIAQSEEVKKIIDIVENFLRRKKLICYGGTAINNILPVGDQFYNKDVEIPDYDFFSHSALTDAKELADIYAEAGYTDVEAKSGVHHGTFKVYVNFIPVADITYIPKELFKSLTREAIKVNGILYSPPNYLRMGMYLELSRPRGDVSRWEKVLKRLVLLNKNYPMANPKCNHIDFMRSFEGNDNETNEIYKIVRNSFTDQGLVFFGGYASSLYSNYMPKNKREMFNRKNPDFDVLSEDPETSATILKERLQDEGFENVKIHKHPGFGEIISEHYEVAIDTDTVAFIYKPLACHSYNIIRFGGKKVKVATIDTMLSFFLAFLYANRPYYEHDRIICMSQYLFKVQAKNRLKQKGVLKRFSLKCVGNQKTLEDSRQEKSKMFEKLKHKRGSKEYDEWFLRYAPGEKKAIKATGKAKKHYKKKKTRRKINKKKRGTRKKNILGF